MRRGSRRLRGRLQLVEEHLRRPQLAAKCVRPDALAEGKRQDGHGSDVTDELDLTGGPSGPRVVVPQIRHDAAREPDPAELSLVVAIVATNCPKCSRQYRSAGRVP